MSEWIGGKLISMVTIVTLIKFRFQFQDIDCLEVNYKFRVEIDSFFFFFYNYLYTTLSKSNFLKRFICYIWILNF